MGEVSVTLKVMPEGTEVDLKKLEKEIKSRMDPHSIEEEPVAFGLKSLNVRKIIPDDAGGTDQLEEELLEIDGVKDVKVIDQRKLL
ncbi:hypothetical protein AKJ38_00185 [candidate division MSBL1 archaeon SCGC-AAA259I14]|uniref:Elongation factor 1-beta n=2 Tax=candidate division MSBL1 TaxID=215777 RepID=A0A133UUL1_9EURY|nr:hypothetical protein AKJ36_03320 [candidate division MSBL1 archaeon SCGC-AAA259I07]KXA97839.1 hypothetical protein AKJ38_00185 [candidate division MSBL1 archaeon SCGC-AAA259I14]